VSSRFAVILGVVFVVVGAIYWFVQHFDLTSIDYAGATMLVVLGVAMGFAFTILLRGSREL
jgi:hypothetical protein